MIKPPLFELPLTDLQLTDLTMNNRVMPLRQQIRQTLLQFPSIWEVRIAIEGQAEGVLEP